jgi:KaiC/GvpD/RAD55 family RecA-like ATPase
MGDLIYTNYYIISFWLITVTFAFIYYARFGVDYPSILEPKWKIYVPSDVVKIAGTATLAFLSISLYFTVIEHGDPSFISLLKNIPLPFFFLLLLPSSAITMIFTFTKALSLKTKLRYWNYLRHATYLHILATFYVLCLSFLLWSSSTSLEKFIFSAIFVLAFAFYLFYALDLRMIGRSVGLKPVFDKTDAAADITLLSSLFFILLFSLSFTYQKDIQLFGGINFESYPFMILFILSALFAFIAFLRVSKESFEELMRKNIWSHVSYFTSFAIAFYVYLIFRIKPEMQDFPLRDLFFIAYLAVLTIDILATRTLLREKESFKVELESVKKPNGDISDLLNSYVDKFFRIDYLEDLWEKIQNTYVPNGAQAAIRFDPAERTFHLEKIDESTRLKVAVGMLLGLHGFPGMEKATLLKKSIEETKEEIMHTLEEKVLMLPDELRSEFDEAVAYPLLFKKVVNDLLKPLKTFIPLTDQAGIFERLKKRDENFFCFDFEKDEIRVKEGARFSRAVFVKLFRLYLEALEERFPFRRVLLYELVRDEIKKWLAPYDIMISDLLDVVPTGVEEMDEIMIGGLLRGTTTLFIAEETKAKQKVLLSFIKEGLLDGNNAIYATSKRPYHQIVGELLVDGGDIKKLEILDFYEYLYTENPRSELVEEDHRLIVPFSKIQFRLSIVKTIKSQPKESSKIVVIDIYDDFSKYFGSREPFELLQSQIEGFKRWNCTSIIAIDPYSYLIKKEGVDEVKKHFDNIILLSGDDKNVSAFIEKLYHGTPTKPVAHLFR